MPIKTYEQQLIEVQEAIAKIESGAQSYSVAGRSLSRADLGTLYAREKELRVLAMREKTGGITVNYVLPDRC